MRASSRPHQSVGERRSIGERPGGCSRRGSAVSGMHVGPDTFSHNQGPNYASGATTRVPSLATNGEFVEAEPLRYDKKHMINQPSQPGNTSLDGGVRKTAASRRGSKADPKQASMSQPFLRTSSKQCYQDVTSLDPSGRRQDADETLMRRDDSLTALYGTKGRGEVGRLRERRGGEEGLIVAVHNHSSIDECFKNSGPDGGNGCDRALSKPDSRRGSADMSRQGSRPERVAVSSNSTGGRRDGLATGVSGNGFSSFPVNSSLSPTARLSDRMAADNAANVSSSSLGRREGGKNRSNPTTFPSDVHAENLHTIIYYLKNHYALDAQESRKGLETMTPEDVLGLVQCFYVDMYRTVRDYRDSVGIGRAGFKDEDPVVACVVEPEDFPILTKGTPRHSVDRRDVHGGDACDVSPHHRSGERGLEGARAWRAVPVNSSQFGGPLPQSQQPCALSRQRLRAHSRALGQRDLSAAGLRAGRSASRSAASRQRALSCRSAAACANTSMETTPEAVNRQRGGVSGRAVGCPLHGLVPMLRRGNNICKHVTGGRPHLRYFRVEMLPAKRGGASPTPHLIWGPSPTSLTSASLKGCKNALSLHTLFCASPLCEGTLEQFSRFFKRDKRGVVQDHNGSAVPNEMCAVLRFNERDLALTFLTEEDRDLWMRAMSFIVERNRLQPTGPSS